MTKRVLVTLVIIAGIGLGAGLSIFGAVLLDNKDYGEAVTYEEAGIAAGGAVLLVASIAGFVAHLHGAFRDLDDLDE